MSKTFTYTTGVITKDPNTFYGHVEVVNLSGSDQNVTVEFFDWGVDQFWGPPTPIPVAAPASGSLVPPNTNVSFLTNLIQSTAQPALLLSHYEIRITLSSNVGVIVNCFAQDSSTKIIDGNTVLHHELIQL